MKLSLVLTSLLAFPLLATLQLPSATIRVAIVKTIRADNVNAFATALAKYGLHVNSVLQTRGYTLLHVAVMEGSPKIVEHLIKNGAEVNVTNAYDATPLDEVPYGNIEVAALLKQAGATYGEVFRIGVVPTGHGGGTLDRGDTLLDIATAEASPEIVDYLTNAALFAAAKEGAIEEVVRLLARDGINIEARDDNDNGLTALMLAARWGKTEVVKLLLDRGADIETKDNNGQTALMLATQSGNTEIVELLLDRDANIEAKNYHGNTALMLAAGRGNTEIVKLLLDRGADIEAKEYNGRTALMLAELNENTKIVELLLEHKAKVEAKNKRNRNRSSDR